MSNIFDLTKVKMLIEKERPVCAVLLDTNVVMNFPLPDSWKVTAGPAIFILSDSVVQEIEMVRKNAKSYLSTKSKEIRISDVNAREKQETLDKAIEATHRMKDLCNLGIITDGIQIPGGWAIAIPSPKQDELDTELKQIHDIVEAFGHYDSKLLLLTRECSQQLTEPIVFVTGEISLSTIAKMNKFPCHLSTGFPMVVKEVYDEIKDWDKALRDMQSTTKKHSIVVEATLAAYKSAPQWLEINDLLLAEGYGVLSDGKKKWSFLWTISFYPMNIISSPKTPKKDTSEFPKIHLDFLGEDDFDQNIFDGIADRLLDCSTMHFEEGKPTLQNAESITEMVIYFDYLSREDVSEFTLVNLNREIAESEGLIHYWTDRILGIEDVFERTACLEGFIEAIEECWKIGQTYKFSFVPQR